MPEIKYKSRYEQMIDTYYSDTTYCKYRPLHLYVEPTNHCNLKCKNCPREQMTRRKGYMSMALYRHIIAGCKQLKIDWVYLFFLGEPLLHDRIVYMHTFAQQKQVKIRLHTNGIHKRIHEVNPDKLVISLNDTNVAHKSLRRNIDKLIEDGRDFTLETLGNFSDSSWVQLPEYAKYIEHREEHNWHGDLIDSRQDTSNIICSQPYKTMAVLWSGKVVPCCVDYNSDYIIGDLTRSTNKIHKVWNYSRMQAIRKEPQAICEGCTMKRTP